MHSSSALPTAVCCTFLCSAFGVAPASAALLAADWQNPGDGLLVRDTTTNLEWLKLTQTFGRSYADVSGQLAGGTFAGLRYASNGEVVDLFDRYFGIALTGPYGQIPAVVDPGVRLASETLGDGLSDGFDSRSPNANYRLVGLTGTVRANGSHFALGARSRWSDTDYFTVADPVSRFVYAPWDPYPLIAGDGDSHAWIGSYLVREAAAPLPAAGWLLGAGLVALGGLARRRRE